MPLQLRGLKDKTVRFTDCITKNRWQNLFCRQSVQTGVDPWRYLSLLIFICRLSADKPMDVFPGWSNYVERLEMNWRRTVAEEDTVVLAGDLSWAMKLEDSYADFFISALVAWKKAFDEGKS